MTTGKQLQELRWAHHLSQQQVADQIGVCRQTVVTWEARASVPARNADRYVRAVHELSQAA